VAMGREMRRDRVRLAAEGDEGGEETRWMSTSERNRGSLERNSAMADRAMICSGEDRA